MQAVLGDMSQVVGVTYYGCIWMFVFEYISIVQPKHRSLSPATRYCKAHIEKTRWKIHSVGLIPTEGYVGALWVAVAARSTAYRFVTNRDIES